MGCFAQRRKSHAFTDLRVLSPGRWFGSRRSRRPTNEGFTPSRPACQCRPARCASCCGVSSRPRACSLASAASAAAALQHQSASGSWCQRSVQSVGQLFGLVAHLQSPPVARGSFSGGWSLGRSRAIGGVAHTAGSFLIPPRRPILKASSRRWPHAWRSCSWRWVHARHAHGTRESRASSRRPARACPCCAGGLPARGRAAARREGARPEPRHGQPWAEPGARQPRARREPRARPCGGRQGPRPRRRVAGRPQSQARSRGEGDGVIGLGVGGKGRVAESTTRRSLPRPGRRGDNQRTRSAASPRVWRA